MKRCFSCFKEFGVEFNVCPYCGKIEITKPKEPIYLVPGTVLAGRYIIGESIGAGGFGIVYKAWDTKLETVLAIKEFYVSRLVTRAEGEKSVIISRKSIEEYGYRKDRFLAEARTMAKFGSHRSIPNVFEFFEENGTAYIVMELLNGVPLNEYMKQKGGKIDIQFAIMIANEVGNALQSLHSHKIIHRDVAPDNIYICSGKEIKIKLMDLGAAKLADSTDNVVDIILKPGYSPPEQYESGKNIGPWTDIYALGATLYAMITGVKPAESTNRKIVEEVEFPSVLNPEISENLNNSIMKAMALENPMRFRSIPEFLQAINGDRKVIPLKKERKRRNVKRIIGISSACIILAIVSVLVYNAFMTKQKAENLNPADITVWFSVAEGSDEEKAMKTIKDHFEDSYEGVNIKLVAIPEAEYKDKIAEAAEKGKLPTLFESSGLSNEVLKKAHDLDNVIDSEQFESALFLDQYENFYKNEKQIPLAIEVPVAYVITAGATSVDYKEDYFKNVSDFGNNQNIACDSRYYSLVSKNFDVNGFGSEEDFLNNTENTSPVMISSTMELNEVRKTLTNYGKKCVYYDNKTIKCNFIYEWSIGKGTEDEIAAGERLLSWMLGNVYQSYLMISECNDGQIPVNAICFESKIKSQYLAPITTIYENFDFKKVK